MQHCANVCGRFLKLAVETTSRDCSGSSKCWRKRYRCECASSSVAGEHNQGVRYSTQTLLDGARCIWFFVCLFFAMEKIVTYSGPHAHLRPLSSGESQRQEAPLLRQE
jgi:hypothetical protein